MIRAVLVVQRLVGGGGGDRTEVRVDGVRGAVGTEGGVVLTGAGTRVPNLEEPVAAATLATLAGPWDGEPHVAGQEERQ